MWVVGGFCSSKTFVHKVHLTMIRFSFCGTGVMIATSSNLESGTDSPTVHTAQGGLQIPDSRSQSTHTVSSELE